MSLGQRKKKTDQVLDLWTKAEKRMRETLEERKIREQSEPNEPINSHHPYTERRGKESPSPSPDFPF